jgi:hypothetical protein
MLPLLFRNVIKSISRFKYTTMAEKSLLTKRGIYVNISFIKYGGVIC